MATDHKILIEKLDEFIRKYYKNQLVRGGIYSIALVLLFFVSTASLEYFARFETLGRAIVFYSFLSLSALILVKYIFIPLSSLYKLGEIISHEQAAQIIGSHFSNIQDKLLNALQLNKQYNSQKENNLSSDNSPNLLMEASINQKISELKPIPFASAIDLTENKKHLKYALIPLLAIVFILFAAPGVITESTKRLIDYNTYYEKPAPFKFIIQNNSLQSVQHEDFLLEVKVTGDVIPENAYIEFNGSSFKLDKDGKIKFEYLFKNIHKTLKFKLFSDNVYSEEYELSVLPNPIVLDFIVELDYPKYIGRKNETLKNSGDLVIPEGTKVKWTFNTRNTKALRINFNDSVQVFSPSAPDQYTVKHTFFKSASYTVKTANEFLTGKDSVAYAVNVIQDQHPSIEVEERSDSISSRRLYFSGNIKDDYGFTRLSFHYKYLNSDSAKSQKTDLPFNKTLNSNQFFHFWDLGQLTVNAGDEIEYYFEVWDNDGVSGAKSSRTHKRVFKAPSLKEISSNTEKTNQEIKKDLESSLKEARDLQKELNDLNKKLLEKKNLSWDDKKKIEDLINKQQKLQKKIEDIQKQNKENMRQQSEYKKVDEKILEKQEQLQELFKEVLTDEMKEMLKQLEKLLEQLDKDKLQETIDQMKLDNKDIEKELDRSLELFKQLEFDQKLQESIDKLNELAEKQKDLSEKTEDKNNNNEDLKQKQDELNKEFEELKKDLENLEKKNQELESPNPMEDTKKDQQDIENDMKESSDNIEKKKNKKASDSQKGAAKKMEELSQKMEKMQMESEMEQAEEDIDALREILENLVKLSFDQEELMVKLKTTDKNDPQYLKNTQQQKKLKDDSKLIEDSLFALSKRVPQLDAVVNREISSINKNMEKSISHLAERQTPQASAKQQLAMTSVNNLALLLNEVLKQMQEQMGKQKFGEGKCNKPGSSGAPKPSAANMKKMQEKINQQIQKMKEQMEKEEGQKDGGQKKGGKSGGGNSSQELAKIAAQQAALRQQLQKLSQELQKDGKGSGGNLDKISKQMEETETDLVNKNITKETLKRQQEIMTRLLEAENAEREREMDEKRESKQAQNDNFSNPAEFFEYKKLKQKEAELLKTVPPTLSPFYKNKVSDYFNNIEE
ncbi:MAG: DUF4175 domain-containing protein [Bacteroidetes bacterium]|nr:DUF4175 domain-containing protein [Bacteroidota bacterium]HET6245316.1 DUF4175 family protein [Bacteroidia bacterium]